MHTDNTNTHYLAHSVSCCSRKCDLCRGWAHPMCPELCVPCAAPSRNCAQTQLVLSLAHQALSCGSGVHQHGWPEKYNHGQSTLLPLAPAHKHEHGKDKCCNKQHETRKRTCQEAILQCATTTVNNECILVCAVHPFTREDTSLAASHHAWIKSTCSYCPGDTWPAILNEQTACSTRPTPRHAQATGACG